MSEFTIIKTGPQTALLVDTATGRSETVALREKPEARKLDAGKMSARIAGIPDIPSYRIWANVA